MNHYFYNEWKNNRIDRIESILGSDWFLGKKILELGCGDGNIGEHFLKKGSLVKFTDAREEHLKTVKEKLSQFNLEADCELLDQNNEYKFDEKFDLILHMGLLYHVKNWKQDLECAMKNTDLMFLETMVNPIRGIDNYTENIDPGDGSKPYKYMGVDYEQPRFTQESIENYLTKIGCRFFRFDTSELNTEWCWSHDNHFIRIVYDWNYDSFITLPDIKNVDKVVHPSRFWMVFK